MLPRQNWRRYQVNPFNRMDYRFRLERDLDHDHKPELILVGNYMDKHSGSGQFLLILGRSSESPGWQRVYLATRPGSTGLHAIFLRDEKIFWSQCIACDRNLEIIHNKTGYSLRWDSNEL